MWHWSGGGEPLIPTFSLDREKVLFPRPVKGEDEGEVAARRYFLFEGEIMKRLWLCVVLVFVAVACSGFTQKNLGDLGEPCFENGKCNGDLVCVDKVCVEAAADTDTVTDDGGADADAADVSDIADTTDTDEKQDTIPVDNDIVPECGDGKKEGNEVCDTADSKACTAIDSNLYRGGMAACNDTCNGWNVASCIPKCGNGVKQEGEVCEQGETTLCSNVSLKFTVGTADCNTSCSGWSLFNCRMTRQWGGTADELGSGVAMNDAGEIFVVGYTTGAFDGKPYSGGPYDIFLSKWDATGSKTWMALWGGGAGDVGYSVAVNGDEVVITGWTTSNLNGFVGESDNFLAGWNASGSLIWVRQWGTSVSEYGGRAVSFDSNGNIFVVGGTAGSLDGNPNRGSTDCFLTKWAHSSVTHLWTKQWGSDGEDRCTGLAIDTNDNIYIAGYVKGSMDGNLYLGETDSILTKWNNSGEKQWTRQWGTEADEEGYAVSVDSQGNLYVCGRTTGSLDGNINNGASDIFVTKWSSSGVKIWTKQWGTDTNDECDRVTVDKKGNIFVVGNTWGDLEGNTALGGSDVFLTKLDAAGERWWTKQWGTDRNDRVYSVFVDDQGYLVVTGSTGGSLDGNVNAGGVDAFLTLFPPED